MTLLSHEVTLKSELTGETLTHDLYSLQARQFFLVSKSFMNQFRFV